VVHFPDTDLQYANAVNKLKTKLLRIYRWEIEKKSIDPITSKINVRRENIFRNSSFESVWEHTISAIREGFIIIKHSSILSELFQIYNKETRKLMCMALLWHDAPESYTEEGEIYAGREDHQSLKALGKEQEIFPYILNDLNIKGERAELIQELYYFFELKFYTSDGIIIEDNVNQIFNSGYALIIFLTLIMDKFQGARYFHKRAFGKIYKKTTSEIGKKEINRSYKRFFLPLFLLCRYIRESRDLTTYSSIIICEVIDNLLLYLENSNEGIDSSIVDEYRQRFAKDIPEYGYNENSVEEIRIPQIIEM